MFKQDLPLNICSCYLGKQHIDYRCYVQTGSSSEHNEKPLTDSLTSENGGETDLVKENQKIKGKARYSVKDLLKQVCFLYISLQKHVFPSLILWLFMKNQNFSCFLNMTSSPRLPTWWFHFSLRFWFFEVEGASFLSENWVFMLVIVFGLYYYVIYVCR